MEKLTKRKRRIYIIISIILIVLYVGAISVNNILEHKVEKEILSQLNNNPNNLYTLTFEDIKIRLFRGHLTVSNLDISPSDSAKRLQEEGKIKKLIQSRIPEFKIIRLKILDLIINKNIDIGGILVDGIQIKYMINTKVIEPEHKNNLVLHDVFSESFNEASIGTIEINAQELEFYSVDLDKTLFDIDSVNIFIDDVVINKETLELPVPVQFGDIRINTQHFMLSSMEHYSIGTDNVEFDVIEASLTIHGFKLIPKYSKEDFNKQIQYNNDLFSIRTTSIKLKGLNTEELEIKGMLSFESLEVTEPVIEIYRDKRLPDAPFKYKALLGGLIKKIPIDINIDTLIVSDAKLRYQEQTDASNEPGAVFFDPLFLTGYHVTNVKEMIADQSSMFINLKGKLMGQTLMDVRLDIDLNSDHEDFSIKGTLEPVDANVFNPMIEHLLPVSINKGKVTKTEFHFSANDDVSDGKLTMEYSDLTVEVIKGKDHTKKARLVSLVANGIVRQHNQPDKGKYITGTIHFERRKDKAIVNFLWNSIKTGIISIVAPIADQNKDIEKQEKKEEKQKEKKEKKSKREERKKDRNQ